MKNKSQMKNFKKNRNLENIIRIKDWS